MLDKFGVMLCFGESPALQSYVCVRTVAVPAALGLRGCELVAEFAVSYRHGGASRAGAATTRVSIRGSRAPPRPLSRCGGVAAATEPDQCRPPRAVGGAHSQVILGGCDSWLELPDASGACASQAVRRIPPKPTLTCTALTHLLTFSLIQG